VKGPLQLKGPLVVNGDLTVDNPYQADLERHFDNKLLGDCAIKQKAMVMRLVAGKPVAPAKQKRA